MRDQSRRFAFTKRAIEAIPAHDPDSPSREAEYSDAECIGLHLRVSKNGRRFFQHRYRYLGRKKCLSLGEYPHISIQEARQRVSEHKALLARDIDPSDERTQKRNDITFSVFAGGFYIQSANNSRIRSVMCKGWRGIGRWINHYNEQRPHSRLDGKTPDEAYWQKPRPGYAGPTIDLAA